MTALLILILAGCEVHAETVGDGRCRDGAYLLRRDSQSSVSSGTCAPGASVATVPLDYGVVVECRCPVEVGP